jgi:hypothetical protein
LDYAGFDQRRFHVLPAARPRPSVGAFLGDGGSLAQPRIEAVIDLRVRMNDRNPVMPHDAGGTDRAVEVAVIEAVSRLGEPFRSRVDGGAQERATGKECEKEKAMHALCVCKARTTVTSLFRGNSELSFRLRFIQRSNLEL